MSALLAITLRRDDTGWTATAATMTGTTSVESRDSAAAALGELGRLVDAALRSAAHREQRRDLRQVTGLPGATPRGGTGAG